jgi:glycosyltransferase involved in cell wall biosynthesis
MPEIVAKHPDAYLVIGGTGPQRERLEAMINDLKISNCVKMVGYIADSDLASYYQSADLFVLPTSSLEGFGLVTVEALASGIPVIGTPVGGTVEILSKIDPILLTHGIEAEHIKRAIVSFLDKSLDDKFKSENLRQHVMENYSWDRHTCEVESTYRSLLSGKKVSELNVFSLSQISNE